MVDLLVLGDVGGVRVGGAAEFSHLARGGVETGAAARDQADGGAVSGELAGDRAADPARGAGDRDYLPLRMRARHLSRDLPER